jgi:glutamate--cysteine ligase catalytic subunit
MRFKPPPPNSNIGWRVEFRSMEVQLTDFENAAFSIFIVLLTRAILSFGLTFYIPISKVSETQNLNPMIFDHLFCATKVDENMKRAHKRDACRSEKFMFRKNVFARKSGQVMHHLHRTTAFDHGSAPLGNGHVLSNGERFKSPMSLSPARSGKMSPVGEKDLKTNQTRVEDEYEELTMDEIINGKRENCQCGQTSVETFPGLMGLISGYLNSLDVSIEMRKKLDHYLEFIKKRATGEVFRLKL